MSTVLPIRGNTSRSMVTIDPKLDRRQVEEMVRQVLRSRMSAGSVPGAASQQFRPASHNGGPNPLVVNVSARHAHVTQKDLEILFGAGAKLSKLKDLYQQGEFASEQVVK